MAVSSLQHVIVSEQSQLIILCPVAQFDQEIPLFSVNARIDPTEVSCGHPDFHPSAVKYSLVRF